ncbi:MAG: hypothetical protein HZB14_06410 [Actinobacteria bacterium]|nr:hypothetical protein [Actinomycetota bacterium]
MKNPLNKALFVAAVLAISSLLPVTAASAAPPADAQTRVIVTLATPDSAPGSDSIPARVDALLATLPAGGFRVINRPTTLPYLTLSVGTPAMSVLQSSGLVASIERDGTVSKAASGETRCKRVKRKGKKVKVCKKTKPAPSAEEIH